MDLIFSSALIASTSSLEDSVDAYGSSRSRRSTSLRHREVLAASSDLCLIESILYDTDEFEVVTVENCCPLAAIVSTPAQSMVPRSMNLWLSADTIRFSASLGAI